VSTVPNIETPVSEVARYLRSYATLDPTACFDTFRSFFGRGQQYVSWIHEVDYCRAVEWLITRKDLSGPINLASPNPLPNREMMRILRQLCGARVGLPAANWMLEVGAFFLRTETELLIKSRRVIPRRLLESGFQFQFPTIREAFESLCAGEHSN